MPDEPNRRDDAARVGGRHDDDAELPPPPPVDDVPTADRDRADRDLVDRDVVDHDRDIVEDRDRDVVERDRDDLERDRPVVEREPVIVERDRDVERERWAGDEPIEVVRTRAFSFGQLVTLALGGLFIALGVVALVRTGIDTPLDQPVEDVLGWDHTPLLGLLEIGAGALLVLGSLRPGGRWLVAVLGIALAVGGVIMAGEADWTVEELAAEQGFGWLVAIAGAVAVVAALLTPRRHQTVTGVPVDRR